MMQGMMDSGVGGWPKTGTGFLLFVVLVLAASALATYLYLAGPSGDGRRVS